MTTLLRFPVSEESIKFARPTSHSTTLDATVKQIYSSFQQKNRIITWWGQFNMR